MTTNTVTITTVNTIRTITIVLFFKNISLRKLHTFTSNMSRPRDIWQLCPAHIKSFVIRRVLYVYIKVICKVHQRTGQEGTEREKLHSPKLFLTSALNEVGGQNVASGFYPRNTRYKLYRKLSGTEGRCGRLRKSSPKPRFDPRPDQIVVIRYTDWANPVHIIFIYKNKTRALKSDSICLMCYRKFRGWVRKVKNI